MADRMRVVQPFGILALVVVGIQVGAAQSKPTVTAPIDFASHPAVGSWFGKADQVCIAGAVPSACANGQPAVTLYMTPTIYADGNFIGNDSLTLGTAPFGPHTTAHGAWVPTSATEFTADYVFMLPSFPPVPDTVGGVRFRWAAQVISSDTAVGYVNVYFQPPLPLTWTQLVGNEFPAFPPEANGLVTSPQGMVKDPSLCRQAGCPLVFKFTIKRVAP